VSAVRVWAIVLQELLAPSCSDPDSVFSFTSFSVTRGVFITLYWAAQDVGVGRLYAQVSTFEGPASFEPHGSPVEARVPFSSSLILIAYPSPLQKP